MCRCCQNCWENFYWNCFEEPFCYDESIANYNPDEDEDYLAAGKNGNSLTARIQPAAFINHNNNNNHNSHNNNNNSLTVPNPICEQPGRNGSGLVGLPCTKIHEEDFLRETQTNVPMLGPEILAVFANSQIFQDHQPTKLSRIGTKTSFLLPGIHSPTPTPSTPRLSDQERLLQRLEGKLNVDATDASMTPTSSLTSIAAEKRITFTLSGDSSPEGSQILTTKKFEVIAEEEDAVSDKTDNGEHDGVVLRPRLIERHAHAHAHLHLGAMSPLKRPLRTTKSVPHFNVRSAASETDIFAITGAGSQISMTPEVPSISFSNLPKNYEDTPTIEKYRVSQSLYSIQAANAAARTTQYDYSMPRYFRYATSSLAQSTDALPSVAASPSSSQCTSPATSRDDVQSRPEKSKRLQRLRGNLPPLLIHSVSFKRSRDETRQLD